MSVDDDIVALRIATIACATLRRQVFYQRAMGDVASERQLVQKIIDRRCIIDALEAMDSNGDGTNDQGGPTTHQLR